MTTSPTPHGSPGTDTPFDPGLQLERTALAWRRTALTCCVGALVAMRVLPARLGPLALLGAAVLAALSAATMIAAHRRYRAHHRALTAPGVHHRRTLCDGALPGALAVLTTMLGMLALVAIL